MCHCGLNSSIIIFLQICVNHAFLHAFCTQEGAWLLNIFFQNHNYQGGTGNFTYVQGFDIQQKALYHQNYFLADSQLYIFAQTTQLVTQLFSQLAILYHQNYLPRNSQLYFAQTTQPFFSLQVVTQLVSYIAICDHICQNPPHTHTTFFNTN